MLNTLVLVGRISTEPRIKIFDDGTKVCNFDLAVDRPFKNQEGIREVDFFPISVWQGYADAVFQYCGSGSVIGIKGRLVTRFQDHGETRVKTIDIIGERVAFIHVVHQRDREDAHSVQFDDEEMVDLNERIEEVEKQKVNKKEDKEDNPRHAL